MSLDSGLSTSPFLAYNSLRAAMDDCEYNAQAEVLAHLLNGENMMLSGPAGAGKTTVISRFIDLLVARGMKERRIAVTAQTGIAAELINGVTLSSWAGFGVSVDPFDPDEYRDEKKRGVVSRARGTRVLILDEVSMTPAYMFTKLDAFCRWAKADKTGDMDSPKNPINMPFGGIQVIVIGDFMQLPPVKKKDVEFDRFGNEVDMRFAMASPAWDAANFTYAYMDKKYRSSCATLTELLDAIVLGKVDDHTMEIINERRRAVIPEDKAVMLMHSTNRNVDKENADRLAEIDAPSTFYRRFAKVGEYGETEDLRQFLREAKVPEVIELKPGAQVMVTANVRTKFFDVIPNGSLGTVLECNDSTVVVQLNSGFIHEFDALERKKVRREKVEDDVVVEQTLAAIYQIPLRLAYAITIHKSQGQTFDGVCVDLSKIHTEGLGYVAMSRVRSIDDLFITGFIPKALKVNPLSRQVTGYVLYNARQTRAQTEEKFAYYDKLLRDRHREAEEMKQRRAEREERKAARNKLEDVLKSLGVQENVTPTATRLRLGQRSVLAMV